MMLRWAVGGALVGVCIGIIGIIYNPAATPGLILFPVLGSLEAVAIRKWIFPDLLP